VASALIEGTGLAKHEVILARISSFPLTVVSFVVESVRENRCDDWMPMLVDSEGLGSGRLGFVLDPRIILRVIFSYLEARAFSFVEHAPDSI